MKGINECIVTYNVFLKNKNVTHFRLREYNNSRFIRWVFLWKGILDVFER